MNDQTLLFFDKKPEALPLYEKFEENVLALTGEITIKVQKSQISFYNKHMFACVSFSRVRKGSDCPQNYIVVTFGLSHRVDSPRIDVVTEPYPHRFTHHVLVADVSEIDEELMGWIREAQEFSAQKR